MVSQQQAWSGAQLHTDRIAHPLTVTPLHQWTCTGVKLEMNEVIGSLSGQTWICGLSK